MRSNTMLYARATLLETIANREDVHHSVARVMENATTHVYLSAFHEAKDIIDFRIENIWAECKAYDKRRHDFLYEEYRKNDGMFLSHVDMQTLTSENAAIVLYLYNALTFVTGALREEWIPGFCASYIVAALSYVDSKDPWQLRIPTLDEVMAVYDCTDEWVEGFNPNLLASLNY